MTPEEFERRLRGHRDEVVRLVDRTLPVKAGQAARKHFRENFTKGGFVDDTLKKWKPARRIGRAKGAAGQYRTLMSSRNVLYNSIKYRTEPGRAIVYTSAESEPYAKVHNEGLRAGRGKGFRMPRRQFIGDSRQLVRKVTALIEEELKRIFGR